MVSDKMFRRFGKREDVLMQIRRGRKLNKRSLVASGKGMQVFEDN
jgi:hypothetical protein